MIHPFERLYYSLNGHMHRARLLIHVEVGVGQAFQISIEDQAHQFPGAVDRRTAVLSAANIAGTHEVKRCYQV